jgi:hypothetical protein
MNSFPMPVTVATIPSILRRFHLDSALPKIRRIEAEVPRGAGRAFEIRIFLILDRSLFAAPNHKDSAKNKQDCQEPKQIACNGDRTLKLPSLTH